MPRRLRVSTAGLCFHVVNRAAKRSTLFESAADYRAFERVLGSAIARSDVSLFAYCIMPNHWHLLLSPRVDGALSRFMHWLTTTHARRWQTARELDGQGAVYQGRFKAIPICADGHFLWVCRYIERNPLRAGLVQRAEDWRWSSLARRHEGREISLLSEWPLDAPVDWIAYVNQPQTQSEEDAVRKSMMRGEPLGNDAWCQTIKERLGMRSCRPRGRQMTPDPLTNT